jgi:hypothetical protein
VTATAVVQLVVESRQALTFPGFVFDSLLQDPAQVGPSVQGSGRCQTKAGP